MLASACVAPRLAPDPELDHGAPAELAPLLDSVRVLQLRDEVVGQHHRMFCEPGYADSPEYAELWKKLGRGEFIAGEFKRRDKQGKEVWLQASYNPIFDADGKPLKVVKFASDVTREVEARSLVLKMSTPVTAIWERPAQRTSAPSRRHSEIARIRPPLSMRYRATAPPVRWSAQQAWCLKQL